MTQKHSEAVTELNKIVIERLWGGYSRKWIEQYKVDSGVVGIGLPQILAALDELISGNDYAFQDNRIIIMEVANYGGYLIDSVCDWQLLTDQKQSATTADQSLETLEKLITLLK